MRLPLLLLLIANVASGSMASWTSAAFSADPATCAYIDSRPAGDRWVLVFSANDAMRGYMMPLNTDELNYWIYGVERRYRD